MVDVDWELKQISSIYHSERHFQLSLGAELGRTYDEKRVRMEWEPLLGKKVDIGVRREDVTISIGLKNKTESATVEDAGFGERRLNSAAKVPEIKPTTDFSRTFSGLKRSCRSRGAMDMRFY